MKALPHSKVGIYMSAVFAGIFTIIYLYIALSIGPNADSVSLAETIAAIIIQILCLPWIAFEIIGRYLLEIDSAPGYIRMALIPLYGLLNVFLVFCLARYFRGRPPNNAL
jgi:hypothetical protein